MHLSFDCIHGSCFIYFTDSGVLGKIKRYWVLIVSISEGIPQNIRQRDCLKPRKCLSLFSARSKTPVDVTQPNANVWFSHRRLRSSLLLYQDHAIEYEVKLNLAFTNLEFEFSSCIETPPRKACVSLAALSKSCSPAPASSCASQTVPHWRTSWGCPKTSTSFKYPAQRADAHPCSINTHLVLGTVCESDRK